MTTVARLQSTKRTKGVGKKRTYMVRPTTEVVVAKRSRMDTSPDWVYAAPPAAPKETGYVDLETAGGNLDTTGFIWMLNTIAPGATQSTRVGKKVAMKGLQIRGLLYNGTSAYTNDVALIVVYDKRPTGSMPAITAILESISSQSLNNDDNASRFRILRRIDYCLTGNATTPTSNSGVSIDTYVDLRKALVVYKSASTGEIADISEGALYIIGVGSAAAGSAAAVAVLKTRVRYYDL